MSVYMSPFHVIFLRGIRQALACNKTGTSIGHASILLHAWSPKNEMWVQSVHRPRVDPSRGRVDAWMRGRVDTSTARFFYFFFFDKSCNRLKIVSVLLSALVERFFVSHKHDFFLIFFTFLENHFSQNVNHAKQNDFRMSSLR